MKRKTLKTGTHSHALLNLNEMLKELSHQDKIAIINLRLRLIEFAFRGLIKLKLSEKKEVFTVELVEGKMPDGIGYTGTADQVLIYSMACTDGISLFRQYLLHFVQKK